MSDALQRKLRGLVEGAGFELALPLDQPGTFRITTKELQPIAAGSVHGSKFRAYFPGEQLQVSTPTELVDVLEQIKKEEAK